MKKGRPVIVLVGELWHGAPVRGFAQAFRDRGWLVIEIDINQYLSIPNSLTLRAMARFAPRAFESNLNRDIVSICRRHKADYLFFMKGNGIWPETLQKLHLDGVETINFYPDVEFHHPGLAMGTVAGSTWLFSTKSFHVEYFSKAFGREITHLNHGFSRLVHRPRREVLGEHEFDWDISYVGNPSPYKLDWLIGVVESFPEQRIAVVGHRWTAIASGTPLAPYVLGYPLTGDALADIIETSKINIALHFGPVGARGWQDNLSARSFQIPASRGFMLHIDNAEIRDQFDVPEEIDVFSSPGELNAKIEYYLAHPAQRQAMNQRAYLRCLDSYSFDHRVATIIDVIGAAA